MESNTALIFGLISVFMAILGGVLAVVAFVWKVFKGNDQKQQDSAERVHGRIDDIFAKLGEIHKSQTESLRQKAQIGVLQTPIPPQTTPCLNSGTVTVSGDINSPLTLSPTDTFTLVFSACDDGAGVVSGTYSMRITSFTGDFVGGSFSFDVTVTLTDFQITDGGETVMVNGDVSISLNTSTMPTLTVSVTSTSLSVSDGSSSHTLTNFSVTQTVDEATFAYTMDASGTLTSSAFTGRVTFSTAASLQGSERELRDVFELQTETAARTANCVCSSVFGV